jgi:alcohol dehydrogenase class IV
MISVSIEPLAPFRYLAETEVVFGPGCVDRAGDYVKRFGARPLIVAGVKSARASGLLGRLLEQLPDAVVFEGVPENPDTTVCEAGAKMCRETRCDCVLAVGGGSPIDAAKAIAGLVLNDGPCDRYFGSDLFAKGALPVVAVPTTAGTGSEVTPYAVLVDSGQKTKRTISGRALFPRAALLDPDVTATMPRAVTIATGLDALSQAMEGIVSKKATPMGDVLAFDAIRRITQFLPRAADSGGTDLQARAQMLYASMLAGCVIAQSGTTLVHGMGYYYTLECGIAHGLANGLLLAPIFRHNALYAPARVAGICAALGCPADADDELPARVADAIYNVFRALGISCAAKDHNADAAQFEAFAADVAGDPYRFRNQIGEISGEKILTFYRESFEGAKA